MKKTVLILLSLFFLGTQVSAKSRHKDEEPSIIPPPPGPTAVVSPVPALPSTTPTPVPQSRDFHPQHTPTPGKVQLVFAGDINLARRVGDLIQVKGSPWVFAGCKNILDEADLVVANLESPVGEGGEEFTEKSVYLKGKVQDLDALSYGGIGLVTLANNHILDYGPEVMDQTVEGLNARGILHTGLVKALRSGDPAVYIPFHGVTVAFLGYCSVCPGAFIPRKGQMGVDVAIERIMVPEVKQASKKADFVVVLMHWGTEYKEANELQQRLSKMLVEAGATLVIGAHPHVLQKVETTEKTLTAYSLGNFLFDLTYAECQDSCLLRVWLEKGKAPKWEAIPLDLSSGRPEAIPGDGTQGKRIQQILLTGKRPPKEKKTKVKSKGGKVETPGPVSKTTPPSK